MSIYYAREKSLHDKANIVNSAEQRGRVEGRKQEKLSMAKKMLISGMDISVISSITELSEQEIEQLSNDL